MKNILNEARALCAEIEKQPASEANTQISVMAAGLAQKLQKNEADPDSVQLAKSAINYALRRVRDDENIRYHMGMGTEAFAQLVKAQAALSGATEEAVQDSVYSRALKYKSNAEKLHAIEAILHKSQSLEITHQEATNQICAVFGW